MSVITDPTIFKAYDIRGIYGQNFNEDIARAVGKAFTKVVQPTQVIVGQDGRVSSPSLASALIDGLTSVGVNVIDVGRVSTDMYYYACATKNIPGIMVTASHNPKEYNGFKMVRNIPYLLSGDEGIQEIRQLIEDDKLPEDSTTPGTVETWSIMDGFIDKIASLVDLSKLKPIKVIADTANGMVGPSLTELFKKIPQVQLTPMYFEVDGTFPNHGGDPLQEANRRELMERVATEKYDLGFAFDPDGDRFFCIDNKGRFVAGDFMTAILASYFLDKNPGATIIYDIRASLAVKDAIEEKGGKPFYSRVGHAYIKKSMKDQGAVFGGEVTGHYYFESFFGCDSGLAPMVYLMDLLSQTDRTLADLLDEYESKYHISGEINNKVANVKATIAQIKEKYAPLANQVIEIDGITCEMGDWRFNVRGSNTEPLIRLNLEATSSALMAEKRDELLTVIKS
ncbi:MAG: phosphomannomutase/phosphoglucomutase [Candidatus Paceibacterota bacterium]